MVISSAALNYKNFFYRLVTWDAIATTPKSRVKSSDEIDVVAAAAACNLNLAEGRLVIDAYTYESTKQAKQLIDVYYLRFAADVGNSSVTSIADVLGISGVLASCKAMKSNGIGWPADFSSNQICCTNFRRAPHM